MTFKNYRDQNLNNYKEGRDLSLAILKDYIPPEKYTYLKRDLLIEDHLIFNESQYLQLVCETTVNASFAKKYPDSFIYENKIKGEKDVDCSFVTRNTQVNIEVKCADFSKLQRNLNKQNTIKASFWGRHPEFKTVIKDISSNFLTQKETTQLKSMDLKMKDFLLSAHSKFSATRDNQSLNVLVVCCDTATDMSHWIGYLHGYQGLFTEGSFHPKEEYSNVDMVLFTNLYHRHYNFFEKDLLTNHWKLDSAFNICIPNPFSSLKRTELNPRLRDFYDSIKHYSFEVYDYHHNHYQSDLFAGAALVIPHYVHKELFSKNIYPFQP